MWIRSQDKKTLIENKLFDIYQDLKEDDFVIQCSACILGVYSTEEKAMKVLDMIQKEIIDSNFSYNGVTCSTKPMVRVFQMPSDSEVE